MRRAVSCIILVVTPVMTILAQHGWSQKDIFHEVRERVLSDIARIPNYTCVETVTRQNMYRAAPPGAARLSCNQVIRRRNARKGNLPVTSWDRLRLEVAIADQGEIYSWAGAARFQESDLHQLIGYGYTAGGDFGPILAGVFEDHPDMQMQGQRREGRRRLLEYGFETPREQSRWKLRIGSFEFVAPYDGTVFIDTATKDVAEVMERTTELPEETGYCESVHEVRYRRVHIAGSDALIPSESRILTVALDGSEILNLDSYADCREYLGSSVLRFESADSPPTPAAQKSQPDSPPAIPPEIPFRCRIVTPIDSDTAAAGDPIEAVLLSPIETPNGVVLVAPGARIHGRVMRFSSTIDTYEMGLRFHSIEIGEARVPFGAKRNSGPPGQLPGMGIFVFKQKTMRLRGLDSAWITATPVAGQ